MNGTQAEAYQVLRKSFFTPSIIEEVGRGGYIFERIEPGRIITPEDRKVGEIDTAVEVLVQGHYIEERGTTDRKVWRVRDIAATDYDKWLEAGGYWNGAAGKARLAAAAAAKYGAEQGVLLDV